MRKMTSIWLRLFAVCLALSLPAGLSAQESDDVQLPEQSDVRIIVDISGSMKDTDPENLRQPAVRLLARLLPEDWCFVKVSMVLCFLVVYCQSIVIKVYGETYFHFGSS